MRLLVAALVCAASAGAAIDLRFQPFCDEAYYGGARTVDKAIRYLGVDVDYPCPTANGTMTALIIASIYGHKEVLRVLLSHGADVNAVSSQGFHALYVAARNSHGEIVRLLLENSEVNPFDATLNPGGFTPLHAAAQFNATTALKALLDDGRLPIDGLSDQGCTPLFYAAEYGALQAVKALLRHGADASIAWNGNTPADIASRNGHDEVVAL